MRCFLFLDDFEEYGCRQWDRLRLNREKTDKLYDCEMPVVVKKNVQPSAGDDDVVIPIPATPVWENEIKDRRSELECESRFSLPEGFPPP